MRILRIAAAIVLVLSITVFLLSCSRHKDSNSGNVELTPLVVTDRVSVVDAQPSSAAAVKPLKIGAFRVPPADSDYNTDPTHVYVQERSVEAFNTVNEILCSMAQTKYDVMLNAGDYKAQIDIAQCKSENADASSAGQESQNQSSGANMPEYEMWTVNSSRADNNSPHIVKVWVHEEPGDMDPAKLIYVKAAITEGKSDTNPYGIFTMNFKASPVENGNVAPVTIFKGTLKAELDSASGKVLLKFVLDGGFTNPQDASQTFVMSEAVTLDRASDGSSGAGKLHSYNRDGPQSAPRWEERNDFDIAYSAAEFLRIDSNTSARVCLSRTSFEETAWRYGMYDSTTGDRINRNSGFPIKSAEGAYGWVGYWGMWFPESVMINNGDTVYKQNYGPGGGTEEAFTVVKSGGKLKKHTRKMITLADIKNIPLNWGEPDGTGGWANYQVIWNGSVFNKVAKQDQTNWTWANYGPEQINLNTLQWSELNFWSESLSGQVRVKLICSGYNNGAVTGCTAPTDASPVIFYAEDLVYPGDSVPGTLGCFDNCPNASASGIDMDNPFFSQTWDPVTGAVRHDYTFNDSTMLLMLGINQVISTTTSTIYQWGVMSGPLFDPTIQANLDLLKCDWDPNQTCGWKAWSELSVFYTWETGPNNWNQFTAIKGSDGVVLRFEAPLQVEYIHSWADSSTSKFYLQYSGFGELQGIPGKCVNMDTGADVDCSTGGPGSPVRWVPKFSIAEGSTVSEGANTYLVKPLEMEQRMLKLDNGCTGLSTGSFTLPTISDWLDPDIGAEPVVTSPPAVIGGVVQE